MDKQPCVYLLASKRAGTRYVGVTPDLIRRPWEHREHRVEGLGSMRSEPWCGSSFIRPWNRRYDGKNSLRNGIVPGKFA